MFVILFIMVALGGAWWMFNLSNENHAEASFFYGVLGAIWAFTCLGIAANLAFK